MSIDNVGGYKYEVIPEQPAQAVLMARSDRNPEAAVEQANAALEQAQSPWRLEVESPGSHPFVTPALLKPRTTAAPDLSAQVPDMTLLGAFGLIRGSNGQGNPGLKTSSLPGSSLHLAGLTRGDLGHVPVSVHCAPPERPPATDRRVVVAILDTAVDPHPWLGEADTALGGPGFWVDARTMGWLPGPRLPAVPALAGRLERELAEQEGHGTFIAGLIRQIAPAAQVLAVHVTDADGTVHSDHLLNALQLLLTDRHVREGDVVCLPFSFRPEFPADQLFLDWLAEVLAKLADAGVTVVAAAGNDGSDDPVYPAAFVATKESPEKYRLRSVGALASAGSPTQAYYSNHGTWVSHWEVGVSVVSAFPKVNASAAAEYTAPYRASADTDDFSEGFARWSGTSFAVAIHAAKIVAGKA
jgi:subtilisin family serine protease